MTKTSYTYGEMSSMIRNSSDPMAMFYELEPYMSSGEQTKLFDFAEGLAEDIEATEGEPKTFTNRSEVDAEAKMVFGGAVNIYNLYVECANALENGATKTEISEMLGSALKRDRSPINDTECKAIEALLEKLR